MSERSGVVGEALGRERVAVRRALGAGLLVTLCTVGLSSTSGWLIVRSAQRPGVLSLTVAMGLVQLFALAKAAGRYLERTQTHRAALAVMGRVRARVARDIEPLLPAGLGPRSADVVDTVIGDVDRVQDLLTAVAGPLLTSVAAGVLSCVMVGAMSPWAGEVLAVALVVDALALPGFARRLGRGSAEVLEEVRAGLTELFDRVCQSGDEYIMVGASTHLARQLEVLEDRHDEAQRRRRDVAGVVAALGTLVNGMATIAVALVSIGDVRRGHLNVALVAVPALTTMAALDMVSSLVTGVVSAARDRAALARLNSLSERTWPVRGVVTSVGRGDFAPAVRLIDVTHSYGDARVLSAVSQHVGPGDTVVVSGPSGGGKTTLARLMVKFLEPTSGEVALDGSPYSQLPESTVRSAVGLVDDAPYVFATTLADNLRVANPEATDEELAAACEAAGLGVFLGSLPDGWDTRIGGARVGMSGGERRRLGVARELLSARAVAIFDEPTEGLDDSSARALLASLRAHYRDGTLVVISHQDGTRLPGARQWRVVGAGLIEESSESSTMVDRA
ncbi:MAG: thiol reductant ABC exporter subunit CydC [Acidobacteriota bacterium]|nr:thiol reductant ABC exporter subunit CydC [Acidobacteriota bacterium]